MKIAVVGLGYVGAANAAMLSRDHEVVVLDINTDRVRQLQRFESPIADAELQQYLDTRPSTLTATSDPDEALADAEVVIIATPPTTIPTRTSSTPPASSRSSTTLARNPQATIVIKSTIPVGFTAGMSAQHPDAKIVFSPSSCEREARTRTASARPG